MEKEENNKLLSLDLQLNGGKTKKIEFSVHYKKTHTNITIKKESNHRESTKRGIIKGYADRGRTLSDPQYLQDELKDIEKVFEENGYSRREIKDAMKCNQNPRTEDEESIRRIVVMPNKPRFTPKFDQIARRHRFKVAK